VEDWALVGVGALGEDPPVQQHVLRLVHLQVDGVAAAPRARVQGRDSSGAESESEPEKRPEIILRTRRLLVVAVTWARRVTDLAGSRS
jgi:hypothetical protein